MKKIHLFILMAAALAMTLPLPAATVLQYDFETDLSGRTPVADVPIQPGPGAAAGVPDRSGNGYLMWGWCNATGTDNNSPIFSDNTPDGTGYSIYLDGGLDGYTEGATELNAWSPVAWTIEVSVMLTNTGGWRTIIGRNGSSAAGDPTADFYLQKNGETDSENSENNGAFRINFRTVGGQQVILDSDFVPVVNQWYRLAVVSDGTTLTMYCNKLDGNGYQNVGSMELPDPVPAMNALAATDFIWTFGRGWYNGGNADFLIGNIDDVRFSDTALEPYQFVTCMPYDASPAPLNSDGSVGTLVNSHVEVTLNFKAGRDPNETSDAPFNPAILEHYIYRTASATDPNLVLIASLPQTSLTNPEVSYVLPEPLEQGTLYYWRVEEGIDDGTGQACPPGDPNNILGPVYSFTTVAATPSILAGPADTVTDAAGNATLTVTPSVSAETFEWYRVGDPDILLTDNGKFSGTTTPSLVITGATLEDEGQYYCIAYRGLTPSAPSRAARLWLHRLMGYWKMDGSLEDSVDLEVPGAPTHDGTMAISTGHSGPGDPNYVGAGNGIDGDAMSFYNDGDYVVIPDGGFFNFFPQGFTASFWYKAGEPVGWRLPLSKLDAGSAGWLFGTDHAYPAPQFTFIVEVPTNRIDGGTTPNTGDGQWHMATVTYNPADTTLRLFTDGEEDVRRTVNLSSMPLPEAPLSIGGRDTELSINGAIDEVRIYSYPLTPREVAQLYTAFRPDEYVCVIPDGSELADFDLSGDCRITLEDFAIIAREWLECLRIPDEACNW